MSNSVSPPSRIGAARTPTAPASIIATVVDPSPSLLQLANGTILRGEVVGQDNVGRALVRTDYGVLSLAIHAHLPVATEIILQLRAVGSELHVLVMHVGSATARMPEESAYLGTRAAEAQQQSTSRSLDLLTLGQPLRAVIQAAPPVDSSHQHLDTAARHDHAAIAPGRSPPRWAGGEELQIRIVDVRTSDSIGDEGEHGASGTAAGATTGSLRIDGVVVDTTGTGQPLVQTSLGTFLLLVPAAIPAGALLVIELLDFTAARPTGTTPLQPPSSPIGIAPGWPALSEALALLQQASPAALAAVLPKVVAHPGPRLASGILFLLSALRAGDLPGWLGSEILGLLETAGRGDLVAQLSRDLTHLARLAFEEGETEWRVSVIPLFDGAAVQSLRLFRRRKRDDQEATLNRHDDPQRFIIEVELSGLGELQLDTLVCGARFDLILRSRRPLPETMRRDLSEIFAEANNITGHTGQIGFIASPHWRLTPIEDTASRSVLV